MKRLLKALLLLLILTIGIGAAILYTGNGMKVFIALFGPSHQFDLTKKVPAPDYADPKNWASLPEIEDLADLVPSGIEVRQGVAPVDVFFIHPTGYLHGADWNSPMDPNSNTEENTKWMLANQASAFNSCCNVYAPRYREASIFAYFSGYGELADQSLGFAYEDVERAFTHFIETRSEDRPFLIAAHSQGSHHAIVLLDEKISGTELRDRMVAAYVLGGNITQQQVADLPDIAPCQGPDDLNCVIHWATYGEGGTVDRRWIEGTMLCTNPLNWEYDGPRAESDGHLGAVKGSGKFTLKFFGEDKAKGIEFKPLEAPVAGLTWAECKDGALFVADQSGGMFDSIAGMPGKNYHGLDYPLFHMDIRENALHRSGVFLLHDAEPLE